MSCQCCRGREETRDIIDMASANDGGKYFVTLKVCEKCASGKGRLGIDYEMRESLIPNAGRGLFALREYKRGECIGQYRGKLLSFDEGIKFPDRTYLMERPADEDWRLAAAFIDGDWTFNDMRLINHSSERPNCLARLLRDGTVWIYALRPIHIGEEFMFNYGYEFHMPVIHVVAEVTNRQ